MKRGEVWKVNLDPTIGSEIKKTRPYVIVNRDSIGILPLKIVVPLTSWQSRFENAAWLVPIEAMEGSGITKKSGVDTFQVRSISQNRFVEKLGELSGIDMGNINQALRISLHLDGMKSF